MPVKSPTPYIAHPSFLEAEDAAVKRRVSQVSVSDDRAGQRVCDVFYRYPHDVKEKAYPFIVIDRLDIYHDTEVQHSETQYYFTTDTAGMTPDQTKFFSEMDYYPGDDTLGYLNHDGMVAAAAGGGFLTTESFVPVRIIYQITTYSRSQDHNSQLIAKMLRRVTPFRRGFIEIPEDGTMRRFDLLNWRTLDVLDQEAGYEKRIFKTAYTLSMNAEIAASDLYGTKKVTTVHGTLNVEHTSPVSVNNNYDLTEGFN